MWLYEDAGRSVLIVIRFQSAFNSATGSGDMKYTSELISGPLSQLIPVAALAVAAIVVVVSTNGRFCFNPSLRPVLRGSRTRHCEEPAMLARLLEQTAARAPLTPDTKSARLRRVNHQACLGRHAPRRSRRPPLSPETPWAFQQP